jgi:uncharacterized protein YjbI with pentapeptide repeats
MSDLFISYSRDDRAFVEKLHAAVEASDRDAWVDWDDIPKAEKFWEEITQGIDGANTFVFIISPSSIKKAAGEGEYCRREIEHAAQRNKRIIPIVYQEGFTLDKNTQSHQVLGERNWIFFTSNHSFDTQFQEFIRTIETDISYVKQHTELTVAAEIWDSRGRKEKSLLWHGKRLVEAEKWLKDGEIKLNENLIKKYPHPTPTPLQKLFIDTSKKYSKSRRMIISSLIIIPLFILCVVEFYSREQAAKQDFDRLKSANQINKRQAILNLVGGCRELKEWRKELFYIGERVHGNCRSLSNSNLDNINLSGVGPDGGYTEGIDLQNVDLSGSALKNATLSGVNLSYSSLYRANLQGANLSRSYLNNSWLNGANFSAADLSSVDLRDSKLSAIFANANLSWANLKNSDLVMASFNNANLYYADLSNTTLYETVFDGADLSNTNLSGAKGLTLESIKLARLCKTQLPPDIAVNPDRNCPGKISSQTSSKQSTNVPNDNKSTNIDSSGSISATSKFTPMNNCTSNKQKKAPCRVTRTYKDGKWSGVNIRWSDNTEAGIIIETLNPGSRVASTHGKARLDGKPAEYFTFSDGGICFRVLEDDSTLCYR